MATDDLQWVHMCEREKRLDVQNIDFEDDVVRCPEIGESKGCVFEDAAEFCFVSRHSSAQASELVLDCGDWATNADTPLDNLSSAQLRHLVLAGRQREQQLQKQRDELEQTRVSWLEEQQLLITEAIEKLNADAVAHARRLWDREAEKERRNWENEQKEQKIQQRRNLAMEASSHKARKMLGFIV
jgi:hypothetical protein